MIRDKKQVRIEVGPEVRFSKGDSFNYFLTKLNELYESVPDRFELDVLDVQLEYSNSECDHYGTHVDTGTFAAFYIREETDSEYDFRKLDELDAIDKKEEAERAMLKELIEKYGDKE